MYIVAEGLLHVYIHQADSGETIRVGQLAAGAFFGEISLLTGDPRTATVKAAVDSYVYEITRDDMQVLLDKRPEIAEGLT